MERYVLLSLAAKASAHGTGVWKDPNHYVGEESLAGLRSSPSDAPRFAEWSVWGGQRNGGHPGHLQRRGNDEYRNWTSRQRAALPA